MKHVISITLNADIAYTRIASQVACATAEVYANEAGITGNIAEFCHAFELSVSESFTNSVRHADTEPGDISIEFYTDPNGLTAMVSDSNPEFDPVTPLPDVTLYPEGGYGLFIIHKLMDSISYSRQKNRNILTMTKSAHPPTV